MATTDITIKPERRLCTVNGECGYFHCWEHYMEPLPPTATMDGHRGGQYSCVRGVVETESGMRLVHPLAIQFVDEENQQLHLMNEHEKKIKEKSDGSSLD